MNTETKVDTIQKLNDLLDAEREALLAGDLDQIQVLLSPKEALIETISTENRPGGAEMALLNLKVKRNQSLLNSALEGIRAVTSRMTQLYEEDRGLATYGSDGKKHDLPVLRDTSVEHRI